SGFGGAVVAGRLAEAGRSVCLLERGRRWTPADYPRTFSQTEHAVWDEKVSYGFLEYRVFHRIDIVQGSGVGGGSLHYFNVQLRAPDAILRRPEWPRPLSRELLDPYYDRVQSVIESAPLAAPAGERIPGRTRTFLDAATKAGFDGHLVPIAVYTGPTRSHPVSGVTQEPCTYTADCLLGCRVHAKNNLAVTFLPLGERHGLEIRPLHVAEHIRPASTVGYVVSSRRLDPDRPGTWEPTEVTGRTLVLSAGTIGSTELLLRARDLDRTLPHLPTTVGRRFSPNGDMIFGGTMDADELVDPSYGPAITAGAFVNAPSSPHVIHLQDLGFPPSVTSLLDGMLPTRARLLSTGRALAGYVGAASGRAPFLAEQLFAGSPVPRFLPYLGMGTDAADGAFRLDQGGRLALDWNPSASMGMYREMEAAMRRMSQHLGGRYVRSFLWRLPFRRLLTAHPLGGCVMSDAAERGVVNDRGEVWGHPGLYVADGSVIPGPLSVNPSLTIAAMVERIAYLLVHGREVSARDGE
ncbi:MAG: GMC family oxidoreductase, partial [Candidatus Dormibacteria bacterium]